MVFHQAVRGGHEHALMAVLPPDQVRRRSALPVNRGDHARAVLSAIWRPRTTISSPTSACIRISSSLLAVTLRRPACPAAALTRPFLLVEPAPDPGPDRVPQRAVKALHTHRTQPAGRLGLRFPDLPFRPRLIVGAEEQQHVHAAAVGPVLPAHIRSFRRRRRPGRVALTSGGASPGAPCYFCASTT